MKFHGIRFDLPKRNTLKPPLTPLTIIITPLPIACQDKGKDGGWDIAKM